MNKTTTANQQETYNNNGLNITSYSLPSHSKERQRYQGPRHWQRRRQHIINDTTRWSNTSPKIQYNEVTTAELIARCLHLTSRSFTSIDRLRRNRSISGSMGEKSTAEESDRASAMPSQMPRSHTSQGVSRQQLTVPQEVARPSTVIGCTQQTVKLTRSRPGSQIKPGSLKKPDSNQTQRVEGWNKSTKIETPDCTSRTSIPVATRTTSTPVATRTTSTPTATRTTSTPTATSTTSTPAAFSFVARPSKSKKAFRNVPSVTTDLLSVKSLYDQDTPTNSEYLETIPSQNKAVETAFHKAINHRTVTSDRLRVGLLTNDITPRVYLQESKGTEQFKKMNLKLREQLTDVYNYRYIQGSLPSSLSSDCDSNDERSDGL